MLPKDLVIFDLEATSANANEAEIVQIAAIHPSKEPFMRFVKTATELTKEDKVWEITQIDFQTYLDDIESKDSSLETVLTEFLEYIGNCELAGHNIDRYDIPLLNKQLSECSLSLREDLVTIDSLKWSLLSFATPPDNLRGYKLGDLFEYFTGDQIDGAHQADKDCEANQTVLEQLQANPPSENTLKIWKHIGLKYADFYKVDIPEISSEDARALLQTTAKVPHINKPGKPFPSIEELLPKYFEGLEPEEIIELAENQHSLNQTYPNAQSQAQQMIEIMGSYRPSQAEMLHLVAETQQNASNSLIQAPTGTGKTRGYLFPSQHLVNADPEQKVIIATHTKVLQQQVYEELVRNAEEKGFETNAVMVKSARDYVCIEALADLVSQKGRQTDDELLAIGLFSQLVLEQQYDLNSLPNNWEYVAAYREARFHIQTNARRCREKCPYYKNCAFQTDLRQREKANILVTNQAWFLANASVNAEESETGEQKFHLVVDEAHNLEDVATEALSKSTDKETIDFHLNRIHNKEKRRGWLRDNEHADTEVTKALAKKIREVLLPATKNNFSAYNEKIEVFLKQFGRGDIKYGLTLVMGPNFTARSEWPKLRAVEDIWIRSLLDLNEALKSFPSDSWLFKNLSPTIDYFKQHIELLYDRRKALHEKGQNETEISEKDETDNYIYLSTFVNDKAWTHVAQPIDISKHLAEIWKSCRSVCLTSATLAIANEFSYITRILGLDSEALDTNEAVTYALSESLPYEYAYIIIPSHLPEARASNMRRFQQLYHMELKEILPKSKRSLSLFTSVARMREARDQLEKDVASLYVPLTRREREDIAQSMRIPDIDAAALGTRSYMEGVDFPDLKVVNLERLPFPIPSPLFTARQELAEKQGLDPWLDVYLPKAQLTFIQAFGRLIRDNRKTSKKGAFILWDKRLLNASYRLLFLNSIPSGARKNFIEGENRVHFYKELANVLELDTQAFPNEEIVTEAQKYIQELRQSTTSYKDKAQQLAFKFWEIESLHQEQLDAIDASLTDKDSMVLLPTGFGKSLTFQIPALILGGLTIVVSPLIALMKDQVESLIQKDLPVAALHSGLGGAEQRSIMSEVRAGRVNLLYVSPERLRKSQDFLELVKEMVSKKLLRRLVLDEAHCLSEWGHDFRPDYKEVGKNLRKFDPDLNISVLTATATPKSKRRLTQAFRLSESSTC